MQAPVMSVHRSSIMAFGLLVLSECVAFGGGNDQVNVQLADAQGEHKLGDTIDSRGESQNGSKVEADKQQGKTIARATDAIPRSDPTSSNG